MNIHRTLTIARRVFRGLLSDWRALLMMFLTPVISIVVFGLAFSGEVSHVRVVVVNQDGGYAIPPSIVRMSIAAAVIANLDPQVVEVEKVATEEEGVKLVESGDAYAVVIFPKDFTYNVYRKMQDPTLSVDNKIRLKRDRTNVSVAGAIEEAVNNAWVAASVTMHVEGAISINSSDDIYGKNDTFRDFFLPGMASFILFTLTFILTVTSFVSERTSGLLARMRVTPLKPIEFVAGYVMAFSVIGVVQSVTLLGFSVWVFHCACVGSLVLAFLIIALLAIMTLSLGLSVSGMATRPEQAMQVLPAIVTLPFLLSGVFWPLEAVPTWLRPVSWLSPLTYAVNAERDVMLRGWGVGQIWPELVVMAIFTIAFIVLSVVGLGRSRG